MPPLPTRAADAASADMLSILEQWNQEKRGLEANFIRQPDLTVWFDLPAEIAAQRLAGARVPDKFEPSRSNSSAAWPLVILAA